jgi:hypothetical protein
MSTKNQQTGECNILIRIAQLCGEAKKRLKCLSSVISPPTDGSKKQKMKRIVQMTEHWILESVATINAVTEDFRVEEKLLLPQAFGRGGRASLFPSTNHISSVLVQVILWSCLSNSCHESITKSLCDAGVSRKCVLQQNPNCVSKVMLWTWLQSCACAIKISVHYSCKRAIERNKEDRVTWNLFSNLVSDTILLEICFANSTTSRSASFFTSIGTNAQPLESFALRRGHLKPLAAKATALRSEPLVHSKPLAVEAMEPLVHSKPLAVEAMNMFAHHLKTRPNLAFDKQPKQKIEAGDFLPKSSHLSSDILTFMLNNVQVKKCFDDNPSVARGTHPERGNDVDHSRGQLKDVKKPLQTIRLVARGAHPERGNDVDHSKDVKKPLQTIGLVARGAHPERGNDVDHIRCQLMDVTKPLQTITLSDPLEDIERESGEIVKKLSVSLTTRPDWGSFACAKVTAVWSCALTLLQIKRRALTMGEKVLLRLFSAALKACDARGVDGDNKLESLLTHLSSTLFHDSAFVTAVGVVVVPHHYALDPRNDKFWMTYFPIECKEVTDKIDCAKKNDTTGVKKKKARKAHKRAALQGSAKKAKGSDEGEEAIVSKS